MSTTKRLLKEAQSEARLNKKIADEVRDIKLCPENDNLLLWFSTLTPGKDSIYRGGTFELQLVIPTQYPIKPPRVSFITKICHPNIHPKTGQVCLDVLSESWSPVWSLRNVCVAIMVMLDNPVVDSPLNCDASNLIRSGDTRGYRSLVKMYIDLYATK